MSDGLVFNPPPGWPRPPSGWTPPKDWTPDPAWPPAPADWEFWIPDSDGIVQATQSSDVSTTAEPGLGKSPLSAGLPGWRKPEPVPLLVQTQAAVRDEHPAQTEEQLSFELAQVRAELAQVRAELARLRTARPTSGGLVELDDERVLQEVGIYRYHHPLENAEAFRVRLADLEERITSMVKEGVAIEASNMFTFDNSLAKGRRMTGDLSKLMLRAYNAEADNCVRSLRAGNVVTAKKRLEAAVASIARLGTMMEMRISALYHALRIEELELTSDFLIKVQEEREAARDERERLREERKAEQELAAERERLDKERNHLLNALAAVRAAGLAADVAELEAKVATIDDAIAQNDYRTANIRAGYVYVISNRGAFGYNIVKIGLTRRLDPLDRVRELGDASVPFPFDVHALFFSEDAVTLENELHREFATRRVNFVNMRREFFFATPEEVHRVLSDKVGNLLEFVEKADATQYLQSRGSWPTAVAEPGPEPPEPA